MRKIKLIQKLIIVISLVVLSAVTKAQDIHFSQFDASPIVLNPSLTGMYNNMAFKATNQYRNQWDAITRKSYLSSIVSYDMPYQDNWGVGAYIINDNSARVYNSFNFMLSGAHNIMINNNDKQILSFGLQAGIIYKNMKTDNYLFDDQYSAGAFHSDITTNEVFDNSSRVLPDINVGVSYQDLSLNKSFKPYGGIAIFHILNPKDNLTFADDSRLPLRFVLHGGAKVRINNKINLDPKLLIMRQRNAMEVNIGTYSYFQLESRYVQLISGINYRLKDAVIITGGIFYKNFIYRVNYDFNVSPLRDFTGYKGGLEFSLVFYKTIGRASGLL